MHIRCPSIAALLLTLTACTLSITALLLTLSACTLPPPPTPTSLPSLPPPPSIPSLPPLPSLPPPTPTSTPAPTPTPPPTPTSTLTPTPTPTLTPTPTPIITSAPSLPSFPSLSPLPSPPPPRRVPNATRTFWVTDGATGERREITARLRVQTGQVSMWVEEGVWDDVRQLEEAAIFFEARIVPTTRAAFGSEWTPGVDNDPHVAILHAAGLGEGVLGYTSSADEFPRAVYPYSNQAEMIVVSADAVEIGSPTYYALLARQFQRLVQWFHDPNEQRWVKEGLAELAVRLNGLDPGGLAQAYLEQPDTSLTTWEGGGTTAQRGAAYLFATYFHGHLGSIGTRALVAQPLDGIPGFDATLAELGSRLAFEDLFADWLAANYLDSDPGAASPRYGYATLDLSRPAPAATYADYPATVDAAVQQFGADYVLLRGDADLHVQFTGTLTAPLLAVPPHSGRTVWWSNAADESLATLTHRFDLSGVEQATLTYWAWYDVEEGYDYATVEVSTDGGAHWQVLSTPSGTGANPRGNNPAWGYTGRSGDPPAWIQERVDLSPYVGGETLVRFAYLTDEALTGVGFLLDDVAVPEIGYADDVEAETGGWEAAGFIRTDGAVPQRYLALLIGLGDTATVERLPLEEDQAATWSVPLASEGWREAVLVLSGLAPLTSYPAPYQLTIDR